MGTNWGLHASGGARVARWPEVRARKRVAATWLLALGRIARGRARWRGVLLHAALLLCLGALGFSPSVARAQSCPSSLTVASRGSSTFDTFPCTSSQGTNGSLYLPTPPSHGTVTQDVNDQYITYTNNGDGVTSDRFVWQDFFGNNHTVTVTITATISISPTSLPSGSVGTSYSHTISASGGTAPYTYSISAGSLPPGLSLNSSTGAISGTPTAGGSYTFTVKATDAASNTATQTYSGVVIGAPTITVSPSTLPAATQNGSYSQTMSASGGTAPYTYAVTSGSLPSGLTLNSATGVLSGTPTVYGSYSFTVTATDSSTGGGPYTGSASYTLSVAASTPTITTSSVAGGTVGLSYSQTVSASGGNAPYSYSISSGSLPPGLSLSSSGIISGTPTGGGSYTFTVKVTDAASNTATKTYSGVVIAAPTITVSPSALPAATQFIAYSQALAASGGTPTYTYAVTSGSLPSGLALSNAGVLSGTSTVSGSFSFTVTVTDSSGGSGPYTGTRSYVLTVTANSPTIVTTSLSSGEVGVAYSQTIGASSGTAPYTFSIASGSLPAGLTLSTAGTLSGTPAAGGSFAFTVQVKDANNATATQSYTVSIAAAPGIGTTSLAGGEVGVAYSQTIAASSGTAPYTFGIASGSLPAGVTLNTSGTLSGTPTASGNFSFAVQVKDANNATATQSYTIAIASAPGIGTASLVNGEVGVAYSQTIGASGGTAPYTFAVAAGSLPAGLTLSTAGTLSGTPAAGGSFSFTVQAKDAHNVATTQSYTLNIAAGLAIGAANLPGAQQGKAYDQTIGASGGTAPYTFSVSAGSLPAGLALSGSGALSGTPAANGNFAFAVQVKDANNATATRNYTLSVEAAVPAAPAQRQISTTVSNATTFDVTEGATGGPFTAATVVSVTPPSAGTASIVSTSSSAAVQKAAVGAQASNGGYSIRFAPAAKFTGTATITYTLSNAFGTSDPAILMVSVVPRPDPSIDPDVVGLINAQVQAARRFADAQIENYSERLESLHGGSRERFSNGLSIATQSDPNDASVEAWRRCPSGLATAVACLSSNGTRGARAGSASAQDTRADGGKTDPRPHSVSPDLAFWSAGVVDFGFTNAGVQRSGFRFTTGGVTVGADYRLSDRLAVGAGLGYGRDVTDIGSSGTKSTGDSYSFAFYGSYRPQPTLFLDGVAGYGTLNFDSQRWVGDANAFAKGNRGGSEMFAALTAGYEYRNHALLLSPYGRFSITHGTLDAFTESGVGNDALTYFSQTLRAISGTLGLRAQFEQPVRWGVLMPYARVEYQHDFSTQSQAGLAYADLASAGPAYFVSGNPYGMNRLQLGLGAKFSAGTVLIGVDYSVLLGTNSLQQGVSIMFSAAF